MVAFDDHDPTASVDTFGRRIWGGAMRPPLTPLRFRFAGRLSAGGRASAPRDRTSSVGGRAASAAVVVRRAAIISKSIHRADARDCSLQLKSQIAVRGPTRRTTALNGYV